MTLNTKNHSLRSQNATLNEDVNLKSQIVTSSHGGVRYLPYAFTENGIAMLSSVLRSPIAIQVNIRIMRAFTAMRQFIASNAQIFQRLDVMEQNQLALVAHHRFLCIDETVYHLGASIKDLGKKWFAFCRMDMPTSELLQKLPV